MSLKAKITTIIISICFIFSLLIIGIVAIPNANINLGGNISFNATDVVATIELSTTGAENNINLTGENSINLDSETTNISIPEISEIKFLDKTNPIVITIRITNDAEEDSMIVTPTIPTIKDQTKLTISTTEQIGDDGQIENISTNQKTILAKETVIYVISISLVSGAANNDINSTWSAMFNLQRA